MISYKKNLSLRAACAAMCLAAAGAAHAQTYKLNLPMDDDPDTVLQTIAVLAKETRITLLLKNTSDDDVGVCVHQQARPTRSRCGRWTRVMCCSRRRSAAFPTAA